MSHNRGAPPPLKDALAVSMQRLATSGAAALCAVALDATRGVLHVMSVGTCGYVLMRPNRLTQEMETLSSWRPYTDVSSKLRCVWCGGGGGGHWAPDGHTQTSALCLGLGGPLGGLGPSRGLGVFRWVRNRHGAWHLRIRASVCTHTCTPVLMYTCTCVLLYTCTLGHQYTRTPVHYSSWHHM